MCSISRNGCQDAVFGGPGMRMCRVISSSDREERVYIRRDVGYGVERRVR